MTRVDGLYSKENIIRVNRWYQSNRADVSRHVFVGSIGTHRGEVRLVNVDGIVRFYKILNETGQLDYSLDVTLVTLNLRQHT